MKHARHHAPVSGWEEATSPTRTIRQRALLTTVTSRRNDEQPPERDAPRSRTISMRTREHGGDPLIHQIRKFLKAPSVVVMAALGAIAAIGLGAGPAQAKTIGASTASFETIAGRAQRVTVGLSDDEGQVLAGGSVEMSFSPVLGKRTKVKAEARFVPIAGQRDPGGKARLGRPSQGLGVYAATVTLPTPGFWEIKIKGPGIDAMSAVEVIAKPRVPNVGDRAPASHNLIVGAKGALAQSIDSRASDGDPVPDVELHRSVIADVLAAHDPLVVVASTPVYCQSQFCGPVTESAARLAKKYPSVKFVHLEIWKDFEKQVINRAAAEWMLPKDGTEGHEPWVWLVGRDGKIAARFDNVVSDAEFDAAVANLAKG